MSSNTCSLLDVSATSVSNLLCSFYYSAYSISLASASALFVRFYKLNKRRIQQVSSMWSDFFLTVLHVTRIESFLHLIILTVYKN